MAYAGLSELQGEELLSCWDGLCGVAEKATVSLGGAATSDNTLGPTPGCDALSEEGSFKLQLERPEVLTGLKGAA